MKNIIINRIIATILILLGGACIWIDQPHTIIVGSIFCILGAVAWCQKGEAFKDW